MHSIRNRTLSQAEINYIIAKIRIKLSHANIKEEKIQEHLVDRINSLNRAGLYNETLLNEAIYRTLSFDSTIDVLFSQITDNLLTEFKENLTSNQIQDLGWIFRELHFAGLIQPENYEPIIQRIKIQLKTVDKELCSYMNTLAAALYVFNRSNLLTKDTLALLIPLTEKQIESIRASTVWARGSKNDTSETIKAIIDHCSKTEEHSFELEKIANTPTNQETPIVSKETNTYLARLFKAVIKGKTYYFLNHNEAIELMKNKSSFSEIKTFYGEKITKNGFDCYYITESEVEINIKNPITNYFQGEEYSFEPNFLRTIQENIPYHVQDFFSVTIQSNGTSVISQMGFHNIQEKTLSDSCWVDRDAEKQYWHRVDAQLKYQHTKRDGILLLTNGIIHLIWIDHKKEIAVENTKSKAMLLDQIGFLKKKKREIKDEIHLLEMQLCTEEKEASLIRSRSPSPVR